MARFITQLFRSSSPFSRRVSAASPLAEAEVDEADLLGSTKRRLRHRVQVLEAVTRVGSPSRRGVGVAEGGDVVRPVLRIRRAICELGDRLRVHRLLLEASPQNVRARRKVRIHGERPLHHSIASSSRRAK